MNARTLLHASSEAAANCSWLRSKKLCGAPSSVTTSCSTPAFVSAASNAGLQGENRRVELGSTLGRTRRTLPALAGPAVEADRARETVTARSREPGVAAAETEPDGEHRADPSPAQVLDRRPHVGLDSFGRRLVDMRHVFEVVGALLDSRGAAEVVERDRGDATLREAEGQFLVEAVEAANVRQDDDADTRAFLRRRGEGGEPVAVTRLEHDVLVRDGGSADDRDRRDGVELEAHGRASLAAARRSSPGNCRFRPASFWLMYRTASAFRAQQRKRPESRNPEYG